VPEGPIEEVMTRFRARAALLPVLVGALASLACAGVVTMAALRVRDADHDRVDSQRSREALQVASALGSELARAVDLATAAGALHDADPSVDQVTFGRWGQRVLSVGDHAGVRNVNIVELVPASELDAWQRARRARGDAPIDVRPRAGVDVHQIITRTSGDLQILGMDLAGNATRDAALREAVALGGAGVSDAFVLRIDEDLPPERQNPAFGVYVPLYANGARPLTAADREAELIGYASLAARASDVLGGVSDTLPSGTELLWYDDDGAASSASPLGSPLIASSSPDVAKIERAEGLTNIPVQVGGKQWRLAVASSIDEPTTWRTRLLAGYMGATIIGVLLGRSLTARRRLAGALAESEGIRRATLDAVGAGIITCDVDGRLLHFNGEARRIHGLGRTEVPPERWTDSYRILRRDGSVPDLDELPLWRALHGETVVDEELIVHPKHETRRIVATSAQPVVAPDGRLLGALVAMHDITARVHDRDELAYQANTDALTGLGNRRAAFEHLEAIARQEHDVVAVFIDLDRFKPVNDRYGHDVGDDVLRAIGIRILGTVREEDHAFRLGGDEFLVLLRGDEDSAAAFCARLRTRLCEPIEVIGVTVRLDASMGWASPRPGESADELLRRADHAMMRAKRPGIDPGPRESTRPSRSR
jgi:diguanylate cyclase (GGDEF)-like protein/PAS domain S-box-containing protein